MPKYIKNITFIIAFALFSLFLFFGIFTFKDYGISIDEEFHRLSGFYWLEYVLKTFGFEEFKVIEFIVFISPLILTSNLSKLPSTVDDKIS